MKLGYNPENLSWEWEEEKDIEGQWLMKMVLKTTV